MKKTLLLTFLCITTCLQAQKKVVTVHGVVRDTLGPVSNVNVFNLSSKTGTFTDDLGYYQIKVAIGDSLKFSSVQHRNRIVAVTKASLALLSKDIMLTRNAIALEEVVVRNTYLQGVLALDKTKTPADSRMEALRKNLDLSKFNMKADFPEDHISSKVKPPKPRGVDPTAAFAGAGAAAYFKFKYSEKLWALRRKIDYQTYFPFLLKEELGSNFFHKELKIPEDRYFHFLEYCNPLGIENFYKSNKLAVIRILKKESKSYLALISKNSPKDE